MQIIKLNFSNNAAAQDMISLIQKEKNLSGEEAIKFSVNKEIFREILNAGWASIALPLWGHDNPNREWNVLDNPFFEFEVDKLTYNLINELSIKENVDTVTSVSYFYYSLCNRLVITFKQNSERFYLSLFSL